MASCLFRRNNLPSTTADPIRIELTPVSILRHHHFGSKVSILIRVLSLCYRCHGLYLNFVVSPVARWISKVSRVPLPHCQVPFQFGDPPISFGYLLTEFLEIPLPSFEVLPSLAAARANAHSQLPDCCLRSERLSHSS